MVYLRAATERPPLISQRAGPLTASPKGEAIQTTVAKLPLIRPCGATSPLREGFGHQLLQICSLIWLSAAFSKRLTWAWLMPISFATCVWVLPFR